MVSAVAGMASEEGAVSDLAAVATEETVVRAVALAA